MSYWIIIILGLVQGACEFLPVSSSGHLVVFYNFFGIVENTILLSIVLHMATLGAVVFAYRKTLWQLLKRPWCKTNRLLLLASLMTIGVVMLMEKFIEESFNGNSVLLCFGITAVLLIIAEQVSKKTSYKQIPAKFCTTSDSFLSQSGTFGFSLSYFQAVIIGLAQGIAALPGISRSGTTIATSLLIGVRKEEAAHFSFLLSIPIILASFLYECIKLKDEVAVMQFPVWQLLVGFVVAFVVGFLCLKMMVGFVKRQKLYIFSVYLILLIVFLLLNKYVLFWF